MTLLIEWSPSLVRAFDPTSGLERQGATVAECVAGLGRRDAVIAVSRRSAFVRTAYVPNASKNDMANVLEMQLGSMLPFEPREFVFGFRLGAFYPNRGRLASAGAVKSELLQRMVDEARAAGLRIRSVLPIAFGAWLAARAHNLTHGAVIEAADDTLSIEIVDEGELRYSRTLPLPEPEDLEDEIVRTFAVAGVAPGRVLACASPTLAADLHESRSTLAFLSDVHAIERHLFTIESPARREARAVRAVRWKMWRALAAASVAIALGAYTYASRTKPREEKTTSTGVTALLERAKRNRAKSLEEVDQLGRSNRVLDVAFRPAQSMSDVVDALVSAAPQEAWFTSLNIARGATLTLMGQATQDRAVNRYLTALSDDSRFGDVKVVGTNRVLIGQTPVTQFSITGIPLGNMPFDRPLRGKRKDAQAERKTG